MQKLTEHIFAEFRHLRFEASDTFAWSPTAQTVFYNEDTLLLESGVWSLLHEIGHANLDHQQYHDDLELLIMEVAAWKEAKRLAKDFGVVISEHHVEHCIDSYRDWLHNRSRCMECKSVCLQSSRTIYECHNCETRWQVPASTICKIRRQRVAAN